MINAVTVMNKNETTLEQLKIESNVLEGFRICNKWKMEVKKNTSVQKIHTHGLNDSGTHELKDKMTHGLKDKMTYGLTH